MDALYLLLWQFLNGSEPPCMDAADANNNSSVNALLDALFVLQWNFVQGAEPPDPGPFECGTDPEGDGDSLGCAETSDLCNG